MLRNGLCLAFGTLTAIRVPPPQRVDHAIAGTAMTLAPLTTLPALLLAGLWACLVVGAGVPTLVGAAVILIMLTLLTRGIHLDGLSDTADGLSAGYDRDKALAVMHRSDIGPSGVAAITLVLLLDAAALTALLQDWAGVALAAVCLVASRQLLAWACLTPVPPARPEGLGATVAGSVHPVGAVVGAVVLIGVAVGACLISDQPWWHGPVVVAAALAGGGFVIVRTVRRLGGITGDVLGATVEIALASALTMAALVTAVD